MQLTIRRAGAGDAAMLTILSTHTFTETFAADNDVRDMALYLATAMNEQKLAGELADEANFFFIAGTEEDEAGYAKVRRNTPEGKGNAPALEIERLYVRSIYQGMKVGAALMQHCIDQARALKCDMIWLGVWEHNHKAIAFYERWGFTPFGQHSFMLGTDEQTDLLMQKKLP